MNYSSPLKDLIEINDRLRQWDEEPLPNYGCAIDKDDFEEMIARAQELRDICEDLLKLAREIA